MPLERLRVDGLRVLKDVDCRLHPKRNYFFGPNGAGKTSLLEACYLIGRGRSFRTRQTRKLIQHGKSSLSVVVDHRAGERVSRIGVQVDAEGLTYRIDRQGGMSVTDVARIFGVDVIDPSIHRLIEGGPSERRRFVDWGVFHVEHGYLELWKRYRRILGQRNAALKARTPRAGLEPWNQALAETGEAVSAMRVRYVERLAEAASEIADRLVGRRLHVELRPGWQGSLAAALRDGQERDAALGHTQAGPHRADLAVRLEGHSAADEASRGQQKLIAAALVIAHVREASAAAGRSGILLVDDPAAELDRGALGRLMAEVEALPSQLIVTGLSPELLPVDTRYPMFHVEQGRVRECYNAAI